MRYGTYFAKRVTAAVAVFIISLLVVWLDPVRGTAADTVDVWFFDIGQGDATLIQSGSTQILIDGGPSGKLIEKLGRVMPFWDQEIEYVFLTHPHADHVTGLVALTEYYDVGEVYASAQTYASQVYQVFLDKFDEEFLQAGDQLDLVAGISAEVLWPDSIISKEYEDPNDGSLVINFDIEGVQVLTTGDAGESQEAEMNLFDIDILKVGHHGSYTSTSPHFLEETSPEHAILSYGEENKFGHPHELIVNRLMEFGTFVWHTVTGDVRVRIRERVYEIQHFAL